ncbi:MAG: 50S ribosomal protein L9 [Candidatus Marinimicrobia bacterium]|nr:50S ribosomal protein L9 [Candidatus Neomarinimicrobiota bacterium]|tara:strand:+ start:3688 stop:4131 length:444 start_codon:yes stop_codon:yes gene_type:complete
MEVILLKEHESLGEIGDIVNVKPGYARNFLFPNGIAVRSSKRNIALAEEQKKTLQKRAERESKANQDLIAQLAKVEISIEVEVGEEDKMFGSVTNLDIHKALTEKDVKIDRQSILLDQPIKTLGVHNIPIKLSSGEKQEIKVYVIKT